MPCPHCGAESTAAGGRCSSCDASRAPAPSDAAAVTSLVPDSQADETRVGDASTSRSTIGPLQPGDAFGNRYRVLRVLGSGGMGVVYQTWDDELGVAVALKVIRAEVMADPVASEEVQRRFKRELLLARQVTHKHVVRIHDLGEVNGTKYITMPFVDGRDLAAILRESGPMPVPRAVRLARQIAAGLRAGTRRRRAPAASTAIGLPSQPGRAAIHQTRTPEAARALSGSGATVSTKMHARNSHVSTPLP